MVLAPLVGVTQTAEIDELVGQVEVRALPRLPSHAPMAMAATLEAPRAVQKRPKPNRPWRPWRELGVVVGIALAALALAVRPVPQQQQPAVELELALPAQQVVVTAVSMDR
jgi:hypothetical protein